MREILDDAAGLGRDPVLASQKGMKPALPKRFYQTAEPGRGAAGFAVLLDGRPVRTPARNPLELPTLAAASLVATEFAAQATHVDPATMPATRLANSIVDGVAPDPAAVRADIARYGASDLVCYRAAAPRELVMAQSASWDPLVAWARDRAGANLVLAEGVMHIRQPPEALDAIAAFLERWRDPFAIGALHSVTTLAGSAIIAMAFADRAIDAAAAWTASGVDEDWNARQWGEDFEAADRRRHRWREMQAACALFDAAAPAGLEFASR